MHSLHVQLTICTPAVIHFGAGRRAWSDPAFNCPGWILFYFMCDTKCSMMFRWCTINDLVALSWCTINTQAAFAWCTDHFVHKVEFSYIEWNGVHSRWLTWPKLEQKSYLSDYDSQRLVRFNLFVRKPAFPLCLMTLSSVRMSYADTILAESLHLCCNMYACWD